MHLLINLKQKIITKVIKNISLSNRIFLLKLKYFGHTVLSKI
jgi:hypothetical protein